MTSWVTILDMKICKSEKVVSPELSQLPLTYTVEGIAFAMAPS